MSDARKLILARLLHTIIYVVMASAVVAVLVSGLTGASGPWLWLALALLLVETLVFVANGLRCPLTAVVDRYSAGRSAVSDTFFPERLTRHTLSVFGPLIALGVLLVALRSCL
jgi:hypothetical protein